MLPTHLFECFTSVVLNELKAKADIKCIIIFNFDKAESHIILV